MSAHPEDVAQALQSPTAVLLAAGLAVVLLVLGKIPGAAESPVQALGTWVQGLQAPLRLQQPQRPLLFLAPAGATRRRPATVAAAAALLDFKSDLQLALQECKASDIDSHRPSPFTRPLPVLQRCSSCG